MNKEGQTAMPERRIELSKVLIVDDAYYMRNLIKRTLKEAGHEIVGEAKNGLEGIELFETLKPDIVTMDIKMPDMSGIETTKRIMQKFPHAIIVAVTGNSVEEIKQEMLSAGAVDYLRKPFQPAFLLQKIDKALTVQNEIATSVEETDSIKEDVVHSEVVKNERVLIKTTLDEDVPLDDMVIELSNESDSQKVTPFIIENEDDVIQFPTDYPLEEEIEKHAFQEESYSEEIVSDETVIDLGESPSHTFPPISSSIEETNISLTFDDADTVRKYAQMKPEPFDSPIRIRPPKANYGKSSQFDLADEEDSDQDFIIDTTDEDPEREQENRIFGFVKKLFKP